MQPSPRPAQLTVDELAGLCLAHLAENPEELARFLEVSGQTPDDLRRALGTPGLKAGLIDYYAANEAILLALCANAGMAPEAFMRVWHRLNPSG